jgi:hypothetical protein
MHRSGTSWVAGSLQQKGLVLGEVNESARYNAKGTRENDVLQAVHIGVLRDSGGSWRDPPRRIVWSEERKGALKDFVSDMGSRYEQWGFKDPRTLLLLDEWKRQVPGLEFVGIYRHPDAVARSLARREFSPVGRRHALRLWRVYNRRLVDEHRRRPFPILRFDGPRSELLAGLDHVARAWDLPRASEPSDFFDAELVHDSAGDAPVPISCARLWNYLVHNTLRA